jgi:chromosome partitioning protein
MSIRRRTVRAGGHSQGGDPGTTYDVLLEPKKILECIHETALGGLRVIPSTIDLAGAEVELVSALSRESRLKTAIKQLGESDYLLLDCPPSLGLLTLNALVASDMLIIPIQAEYFALEGLVQLFKTINLVKEYLNPDLEVLGLLLTMTDQRTRLSRDVVEEVRRQYGNLVFETVIPRNIRISESPSFGKPVVLYDPNCTGSVAYKEFSEEVEVRCRSPRD